MEGLYGLAAANAYLSLHPDDRLVILESTACIGGVWSHGNCSLAKICYYAKYALAERVYEEFWTQTPTDMAMFSNLPLKFPHKREIYFDFFPAKHITQYLSEYVDQEIFTGHTIRQRILFNSKVVKIDFCKLKRQWQILCEGVSRTYLTSKLLVAAGLTSRPNITELPGQNAFGGILIHHIEFGRSTILKDPETKHVVVLGGAKSAADMVYAAAKAGKKVSWIIRKSGSGPAHFVAAKGIRPYRNSNELLYTRLTAALSPSIWNPKNRLVRFLHGTKIGRKVIDWIWNKFDTDSRREAGFHGERGVKGYKNGFANLEPDTSYVRG